jgi:hypothetical protein
MTGRVYWGIEDLGIAGLIGGLTAAFADNRPIQYPNGSILNS